MKKIKILTLVAFTSVTLTACNTQTYYEKHNMLNNKQPCPAGTQADQFGMECKPVAKEIIPENETKLEKFNRLLGKISNASKKNEALNQQSSVNKKECLGWQTECLREQGIYNYR